MCGVHESNITATNLFFILIYSFIYSSVLQWCTVVSRVIQNESSNQIHYTGILIRTSSRKLQPGNKYSTHNRLLPQCVKHRGEKRIPTRHVSNVSQLTEVDRCYLSIKVTEWSGGQWNINWETSSSKLSLTTLVYWSDVSWKWFILFE